MKPRQQSSLAHTIFYVLFLVSVTLAITPNSTFNVVSAPKSFLIGIFSMIIMLLLSLRIFVAKSLPPELQFNGLKQSWLSLAVAFWFFAIFVCSILSDAPFQSILLGTDERKLGFTFYFSMALFAVTSYILSNNDKFQKILFWGLSISAISVSLYSLLQNYERDFFVYSSVYEDSSSTLGNPNFVSGFLSVAIFANLFLFFDLRSWIRLLYLIPSIFINLLVLIENRSFSGKIALAFSLVLVAILFFICRTLPRTITVLSTRKGLVSVATVSIFGFVSVFFSSLGTRLIQRVVDDSRIDYWNVSVKMIKENALIGLGPDTFEQYFLRYRAATELIVISQNQVSNSPHSLPLEMLQVGGVLLFIPSAFLLLTAMIGLLLQSVIKIQSSSERSGLANLMILGSLIAFAIQAWVNVTSIPISVWAAAILGNAFYVIRKHKIFEEKFTMLKTQPIDSCETEKGQRLKGKYSPKNASYLSRPHFSNRISSLNSRLFKKFIFSISFLSMGTLIGYSSIASFKNEINFREAAVARDGLAMIDVSKRWPQEPKRLMSLANSLLREGYERESMDLTLYSLNRFPDEISFWLLLTKNSLSDEKLLNRAWQEVTRLDPLYEVKK